MIGKRKENKEKVKDKKMEEQGSQLLGQRSIKNDENGATMKKEDGCHKNKKTGQRTKRGRKCQKKMEEGQKTRAKRGKKGA